MFTSWDYGQAADTLSAPYSDKTWTAPGEFNLVKAGSLRRRLSIPHPFAQRSLARICAANWTELERHTQLSAISLTRPVPSSMDRSLEFCTPYGRRGFENLRRLGRARYTVVTDISDYYGSVYTHSIEWALDSKAAAKANLRSGSTRKNPSLGAKLDAAVRNCQEGQTKGIAISPDTSLLISEVVMCALDVELETLLPGAAERCIRFMDDVMFAARSRAEAEDFLNTWETILGRYHLALNPRKTQITDGPPPPEQPWHVDLLQFRIRQTSERATTGDIYSFASKAFALARAYPEEAILGYAVKKIHPKHLKKASWKAFEDFLYACAVAEPAAIDKVVRVLAIASTIGQNIDRSRAAEVFNEICEHHAPLERGHQVTWAMAMLLVLGQELSEAAAQKISLMHDNSSLLTLFHFIDLKRVAGVTPDMTPAILRAEDSEAHLSEDWLLGYECARNSWASPTAFQAESHWNELLSLDIAFFKAYGNKHGSTQAPNPPPGAPTTPSTPQPPGTPPAPDSGDVTSADPESDDDETLAALATEDEQGTGTAYP